MLNTMTTYHNPTAILKEGKVYFGFHAYQKPYVTQRLDEEYKKEYAELVEKWQASKQFVEFKDQEGINKLAIDLYCRIGIKTETYRYNIESGIPLDSIVHRIEVVEEVVRAKTGITDGPYEEDIPDLGAFTQQRRQLWKKWQEAQSNVSPQWAVIKKEN